MYTLLGLLSTAIICDTFTYGDINLFQGEGFIGFELWREAPVDMRDFGAWNP